MRIKQRHLSLTGWRAYPATVTYNLPMLKITAGFAEEYGGSQELVMVATNNAVYYKQAGQTSWTNYSTGLPTKSPTGFSMYDNGTSQSRIRCTTYGGEMWGKWIRQFKSLRS